MNALRSAVVAAAVAAFAVPAGAATTFDFFWTGDPSADATITSSGDTTAGAFGTFLIDAGPNDVVGPANVLSFSLTFGTAGTGPFEMTNANASEFLFDGTVSADGTSIAMRDLFVRGLDPIQRFGCDSPFGDCIFSLRGHIGLRRDGGSIVFFNYATDDAARASLQFTAQETAVIPVPASLPLLLGAVGLFAVVRRRAA
jgi:hypothetical protein